MFRIYLSFTLLYLTLFSAKLTAQGGGCVCTNCPQFMQDLFVGSFNLNVQGATNATLGQNGQAVCGVHVTWNHTAICDISISLTAPSGQTVTLVGPIGQFCTNMGNVGTTWDVTFVPCNGMAAPDPGFANQWNNNQSWGSNNNYSGSYFPYSGCLENLTGPVNGNWVLTVVDGQAQDTGNLLNFEVIFCDPSGINCLSCAANAGVLPQPDVKACQGSSSLALSLPPDYPSQSTQPPIPEYAYTYVIAGQGGIIQEITPSPDLSGYQAGTYTVCGMSYYASQANLIPNPNGVLTITQLSNQLHSKFPPFCGDITTNCVNVTIIPLSPDLEETEHVCAPACFEFFGSFYCLTGSYTSIQTDANGCPFNATLDLTASQPTFKTINEVVCEGHCSANSNFYYACSTGTYTTTLMNAAGCDSTLTLNLTVLNPVAAILPPASLSCSQSTVTLYGTNSSTGSAYSYQWLTSNGGHLVGPTNQIIATADAPGLYQLRVCRTQAGVTCCDTAAVTVSSSGNLPAQPSIVGSDSVCIGNVLTYAVASGKGSNTYAWSLPSGGTLLSGQGNDTIQVRWNAMPGGNICCVAANSCGASQPGCLPVVVSSPPDTPSIQGPLTVCTGTQLLYTADSIAGAKVYLWQITGGSIVSGDSTRNIVVQWADTAANAPKVCLRGINQCGNGPQICLDVLVSLQPNVFAGMDTALCGLQYNLHSTSNNPAANGHWRLVSGPGNAIFTDSTNADSPVKVATGGTYLFEWKESAGACSDQDSVQISFNPIPTTGLAQYACDATNQFYTVSFPVNGGAPPFAAVNGAFVGNTFFSDPIGSAVPYSYIISDANGCVSAPVLGSFNCNCQTNAGQMAQNTLEACIGDSVAAILPQGLVLDGNDVGVFALQNYAGTALGAVIAYSSSGKFGFGPNMTTETTYYVSYVAGNNQNGLPDLNDPCLSVAAGQPILFHGFPAANAGLDKQSCGKLINVSGSPGSGSEKWSVISAPPGGLLGLSNPNNSSTDATASAPGIYQLQFSVSANGCTALDTVSLTYYSNPIIGATLATCDNSNTHYTLSFPIGAGVAPYSVNGQAIPGALYTSPPINNNDNYNFTVTDANGCVSAPVSGSHTCNCGTFAGQVPLGQSILCAGDSITVSATGQFLNPGEVSSYILHTKPATPVGDILAENHSGHFGFIPGMSYDVTYYVSAVAGDNLGGFPDPADPCRSVSLGAPVVFKKYPSPNAGADLGVCSQNTLLGAIASPYAGAWTFVSGPGTATFANPQVNNSAVSVTSPGIYLFRWSEVNGPCIANDDVQASFWENPAIGTPVTTCNNTNTGYTLDFSVSGGTAPYTVSGLNGSFNGNTFSSTELPNGAAFSFSVKDQNGCQAATQTGSHTCACATNAGTMALAPLEFCAVDPATASWNNNATLDGDDAIQFILHSTAGATLGAVYATSSTPMFPFTGVLSTGVTYYISAIAGSLSGSNINLADPCLSIAPGTPVRWKPMPQAAFSGAATICNGSSTLLTFSGMGTYPLTVNYNDGVANQFVKLLNPQNLTVPVAPTQNTVYTLLSVSDGTLPVCTSNLNQNLVVQVSQAVHAGMASAPVELCAGTDSLIQLGKLISGADPGGVWTETSGIPSGPGGFNAAAGTFHLASQAPGSYVFKYTLDAAAPCPDQSVNATVNILPTPKAQAGSDQTLDCLHKTATLTGSSSGGSGIQYRWTLNGTPVGTSPGLTVTAAGTYQLQITNAAGCSATDEAVVTLDSDSPAAQSVIAENISCYGEKDGSILVGGVTSGKPPVTFAIDGVHFGKSGVFNHLPAGVYTVTLRDSAGCTWESKPLSIIEPPSVVPDLIDAVQVVLGEQVNLEAIVPAPLSSLASVVWKPLLDTLHKGTLLQQFIPLHSLDVELELTDTAGCFAHDRVHIKVLKPERVYIPNVFRPGSPYQNDLFYIYCGSTVEQIELLQIYNRWGEHLFEVKNADPDDLSKAWDGMYKGQKVLPGVYVYLAKVRFLDGTVQMYTGDVTVEN